MKVQNFYNVRRPPPHKYLLMSGYLLCGNVVQNGDWFWEQRRCDRCMGQLRAGAWNGAELSFHPERHEPWATERPVAALAPWPVIKEQQGQGEELLGQ